ncbi:S-methyl thiohydantoin desulfurase domain-containing protein [[Clostridium] polysaccharolyticum]|uniref:DUF917 family protein n=1 Tax=[Clostridium] polysaccharolyticum TaxID=29364 RepID=A0A1I0DDS6_9FIRM|nr:DUF917 family protein [[Clostridium] polysaccharolyticum]SET30165.1 DUF917 family protein [[Clostridium] polysaccharolyticum]
MKEFNYDQICEMLIGSTFLAGGAGGSLEAGLKLFENLKEETLKLYEIGDLEDTPETSAEYASILAVMGSPSELEEHDFASILSNTILQMRKRCTACSTYKKITHVIPFAYGGVSTAIPAYLALTNDEFKLADADGSGRAVPSLDTALVSLNGAPITPFVMANETNDSMCIDLANDTDAAQCQIVSHSLRTTSPLFTSVNGAAGWPIKSSELKTYANPNSLTYAQKLGACISQYIKAKGEKTNTSVFDYLNAHMEDFKGCALGDNTKGSFTTLAKAGKRKLQNGKEFGVIQIYTKCPDDNIQWEIRFINESMVIFQNSKSALDAPVITAPSVITIFDETDNIPLTNDYILAHIEELKDHKVTLGVMPAPAKWWENREVKDMTEIWRKSYDEIDYRGFCLRYDNIEGRL